MHERSHRVRRPLPRQRPLPARALEDLRFIRETMERSAAFTATPGWGQVAVGIVAGLAAWLAHRQVNSAAWLTVWLGTALLAMAIAALAVHLKAVRTGLPLTSGPALQCAVNALPPLAAATLLTPALYFGGLPRLLPGMWMLLYGAGAFTGSAFSIRLLRVMGAAFMLAGAVALFVPPRFADLCMALGFGGLHVAFGVLIARQHGG